MASSTGPADPLVSVNGTPGILVNPLDPSMVALLDPEFVEFYNANIGTRPATHQVPFSEVRAHPENWRGSWARDYSGEPGVDDLSIPSRDGHAVPTRTYRPDPKIWGPGPYPGHVNYHGGGYVFGDLTTDAEWCMTLRNQLGLLVFDVDYRLCPEHRFGKNIEDGWAVLKYVHENAQSLDILSSSISISGISSGGGLCCVIQHLARDAGIPIKLAVLTVPTTDFHIHFPVPEGYVALPSIAKMANAPMLGADRLAFFRKMVFPEEHREYILGNIPLSWRAPLHSPNFKDIGDTFVATAEFDPLVDEGEAYGRKILEAGGKVTFRRYLGVPHPFGHMKLAISRMYQRDVCDALSSAHSLQPKMLN